MRRLLPSCLLMLLLATGCGYRTAATMQPPPVGSPVRPAVTTPPAARPAPLPIPVLMYHVVDTAPSHSPNSGLYVDPGLFAAQLAALKAAGYEAITLRQAYDIWQGTRPAPPRPVVLTFDDGYLGVFQHAVPLLASYTWPAVLNLLVARLDVPGGLTTDQVRQMIGLGWEVDDHTLTHRDLTQLPPAQVTAEVAGAAQRLRERFGVPVEFFCYPAGRYNPAVVAAVRQAGFLGAVTTWPGDAYPPTEGYWTLDRVRVSGGESPQTLLAALKSYAQHLPSAPPAAFPTPRPQGTASPRP